MLAFTSPNTVARATNTCTASAEAPVAQFIKTAAATSVTGKADQFLSKVISIILPLDARYIVYCGIIFKL